MRLHCVIVALSQISGELLTLLMSAEVLHQSPEHQPKILEHDQERRSRQRPRSVTPLAPQPRTHFLGIEEAIQMVLSLPRGTRKELDCHLEPVHFTLGPIENLQIIG